MELFYIILLIFFGLLFLVAELVLLPGVTVGAALALLCDGCAVWQFRNETGDGTITTYEIFSGVMLAFNDFHMERYECDFVADRRMLAIDHCREGRMDYAASDNLVAYAAAGDMQKLRNFCCGAFAVCHRWTI